jgi:preprotein translocase subunit SecA
MYDVCEDLATQFQDNRDFGAFKIEVMKHLAIEPEIEEGEFLKGDLKVVGDKLYQHVKELYTRKTTAIAEQMLPTLTQILTENGDRVENIVIPFTDGIKGLQIYVNLQEAVNAGGRPVLQTLEKNITLGMIDDAWKDHLRAMDDLRQSVQLASYEQKDPLLIYKFEAFNLFKQMLLETNRSIVSFLIRAGIPMQETPPQAAQLPQQRTDMSRMRTEHESFGEEYYEEPVDNTQEETAVKRAPVQAAPKIGRNDACPCGSGKKYKNCHGRGLQ